MVFKNAVSNRYFNKMAQYEQANGTIEGFKDSGFHSDESGENEDEINEDMRDYLDKLNGRMD
jgi:hypothetical protein